MTTLSIAYTIVEPVFLGVVIMLLAILRTSARVRPRICKMCGNPFSPHGPQQHICGDCAAANILRDIERDEKLNEQDDEPRGFGIHVQGYR